MKRTPQILHATNPAHRRPPVCSTAARTAAARRALWVLGPLATAVPVPPVLLLAGAGADWEGHALVRGRALGHRGEFRAVPLARVASRRLVRVQRLRTAPQRR